MVEEMRCPSEETHKAIWDAVHDTRQDIKQIRTTVARNEALLVAVTVFLAAQFGMEFLTSLGLGSILGWF